MVDYHVQFVELRRKHAEIGTSVYMKPSELNLTCNCMSRNVTDKQESAAGISCTIRRELDRLLRLKQVFAMLNFRHLLPQ
jgi:hypothetical protein